MDAGLEPVWCQTIKNIGGTEKCRRNPPRKHKSSTICHSFASLCQICLCLDRTGKLKSPTDCSCSIDGPTEKVKRDAAGTSKGIQNELSQRSNAKDPFTFIQICINIYIVH